MTPVPGRTPDDEPLIEFFYADPVDANGNVVGSITMTYAWSTLGPVRATKVPASELGLEDAQTITARVPERPRMPEKKRSHHARLLAVTRRAQRRLRGKP